MTPRSLEPQIEAVLAETPVDVVAAYLYGSRARGSAGATSDVDLAVLLARAPAATLKSPARDLESQLERALRLPVEVIVLNGAPADLVHRVLRDGKVLLDRDRATRIRFEVQARNEYFDLAPLRRLYRRLPA